MQSGRSADPFLFGGGGGARRDAMTMTGLNPEEWVALVGGKQMLAGPPPGYRGQPHRRLSSEYFLTLLTEEWKEFTPPESPELTEYKAQGHKTGVYAVSTDLMFVWDPEFRSIAETYASCESCK